MILTWYLRRRVLRPFLVTSLILVTVFASFMAARYLSQAAEGKIATQAVGRFIFLRILIAQEVLLPATFFFSVFLALNRLYRRAEMVAMFAAGFSLGRVYYAVLSLALFLSVVTALFSLEIRPWAWTEFYRLKANFKAAFDLSRLRPGVFYELPEERVFFAEEIERERLLAKKVFLYGNKGDFFQVIRAREARQERSETQIYLILENGRQYEFNQAKALTLLSEFETLKIPMATLEEEASLKVKAIPTKELWPPRNRQEIAELQWRLLAPVSVFLLALLALTLSPVRPREMRLGRFPLVIIFFALYFYAAASLKKAVAQGFFPPWPGVWWAPMGLLFSTALVYFWTGRR